MPKQSTSKGTTVQVRVGANMRASIEEYAKAREQSVGEFVRYCIWTYMDSTPIDENEIEETDAPQSDRAIELGEVRRG